MFATLQSRLSLPRVGWAGLIVAVPEVPVEDVTLEHISIDAPTGLRIGYTKGITLRDVHIRVKTGLPVEIADTVQDLVKQ